MSVERLGTDSVSFKDVPGDREEHDGFEVAVHPLPLTVCHILDQVGTTHVGKEERAHMKGGGGGSYMYFC